MKDDYDALVLDTDVRKKALYAVTLLFLVGAFLCLLRGVPDAFSEYRRAKHCTEAVTAERAPVTGDAYFKDGQDIHVEYIDYNFIYKYDGKQHTVTKTFMNSYLGSGDTVPEKITVLVNPDDPAEYVFSDDRYADVDNTMIKIGGALVGMAMFVFLSGKLLLKDYA